MQEGKAKEEESPVVNPIDPDKITDRPGHLPYPHHIGSPAFVPNESGAIKKRAFRVMHEQSDMQLAQIKEQIDLLAAQARKIQERIEVSKAVYGAEMSFEPLVGEIYYLYAGRENEFVLSMVPNDQWGKKLPFEHFVATVRLLADHTWEVLEKPESAD